MSSGDLEAQLDRVRLESDTLYAVIAVIAAAPDLDGILDRVVDLLTEATGCHACFVYLRHGDRLRLRAASRVFSHAVGRIDFSVEEGLAGWSVRNGEAAVIRENAQNDPRTNYIAELQEERFQSMVTVPVAARSGEALGVIVLHTVAPREFDESTLNFLVHTASLLAGAIENATLYEEARQRVADLQRLSRLSQRIAAVDDREALYEVATAGVRDLLGADACRLYELDRTRGQLLMAAADPPARTDELSRPDDDGAPAGLAVLLDVLGRRDEAAPDNGPGGGEHRIVAPITAGREQLGALLAVRQAPWEGDTGELLRAVAGQVAVALEKAALIERLTGTNIVHELFAALDARDCALAEIRAREARFDFTRRFVAVCARPIATAPSAADGVAQPFVVRIEELEAALRRLAPATACVRGAEQLRALCPVDDASAGAVAAFGERLAALACDAGLVLGRSELVSGADGARRAVREAADAARIAQALRPQGGSLGYGELGAYRYLAHIAPEEMPDDRHGTAVAALLEYDARRGSALIPTLERYLSSGRNVAVTARELIVHPNTLRQRLERIESLTGLNLAQEDLLSLELALKLARLHGTPASRPAGP